MNPSFKRPPSPTPPSLSRRSKKPWRTPRKTNHESTNASLTINPGDAGIWATCDMHKEGKATAELRDLFEDYAARMFGEECLYLRTESTKNEEDDDPAAGGGTGGEAAAAVADIEAEIANEIRDIKASTRHAGGKATIGNQQQQQQQKQPLFQAVKVDVQCVLFFKTRPPVDPVTFVERICRDAAQGKMVRRTRCVRRLSPMTRMGRASWEGLKSVGEEVVGAGFFEKTRKKFAIRPTIRNHSTLKRDEVIRQVAQMVGPNHSVDLKNYDSLILVDIYQNILGMSVVNSDFEELKRFNLAEIYDPTPRPRNNAKTEVTEDAPSISNEPTNGNVEADITGVAKEEKPVSEPTASEVQQRDVTENEYEGSDP